MIFKKRIANEHESRVTPEALFNKRRHFLKASGGLSILGLLPSWALAELNKDRFSSLETTIKAEEKLTAYKDIITYNNFYELGYGKTDPAENADALSTANWKVTIDGECDKPGTYDLEDLLKPHAFEERIYRFRCVEAWSMVVPWVGFSLGDLLKRFEPNSRAKYIAFESIYDPNNPLPGQRRDLVDWPYREGLRMDEAMHPLTMLVTGIYGKPLLNQNGAPLRLVVPWKYGFKSIKSIVKISFVEKQPPTSWNQIAPNEYGFYSNVNPSVNHPRWSQRRERVLGELFKQNTRLFNGYEEEVASLYAGMDLKRYY